MFIGWIKEMNKEKIYQTVQEWRKGAATYKEEAIKGEVRYITLPDQKVRVLTYQGEPGAPLYFNLHGGGFVMGCPEEDDVFCNKVNKELGIHVINIDYPLAPENPFPKDKKTVYDVIKEVVRLGEEWGMDAKRLLIGGHSAGANIATAICLMAKKRNEFSFLAQILDYPPLDLARSPFKKFWTEGAILPEVAKIFNSAYRKQREARDSLCSPMFATEEELVGLPDTLLITCERDSLREEGESYAKKLMQAGVEVTGKRFLGRYHGFSMRDDEIGREAMDYMIQYMQVKLTRHLAK